MDGCDGSDRFRICQKLWETVQMNTEVDISPQMRLLTLELCHSFVHSSIFFPNECVFSTGDTGTVE